MNDLRILQLHSNYIEYEVIKKEIPLAEDPEKKKDHIEEIVVLFTAIEEGDDLIFVIKIKSFQSYDISICSS